MKTKTLLIALAITASLIFTSYAAIPHVINFQGKATNTAGSPLDGAYALTVRIYDAQTGGNKEWEEVHSAVQITNGIFQVLLGSVTPLDLDFKEDYWISVQIDNDSEMSPRTRLASVGYAYRAESFAEEPSEGVPTGAIMAWITESAPDGWLLCDGGEVSRTTYAKLFSVISTTYGSGDGSTTFNVPDLRGRFALGKDNMGGTSANRASEAEADTLGGVEGNENGVAAHTHAYYSGESGARKIPSGSYTGVSALITTGSTGDAVGGNMPPFITVNYVIKA